MIVVVYTEVAVILVTYSNVVVIYSKVVVLVVIYTTF